MQNVAEPVCRGQRGVPDHGFGSRQAKGREIFQSEAPQSHTDMQPVEMISVVFL